MPRKQVTLLLREKARRVRHSKAYRRQGKREFAAQLAAIDHEAKELFEALVREENVRRAEEVALEAKYRKRQLVAEFGPEKAEEIDWGERALQAYCETTLLG